VPIRTGVCVAHRIVLVLGIVRADVVLGFVNPIGLTTMFGADDGAASLTALALHLVAGYDALAQVAERVTIHHGLSLRAGLCADHLQGTAIKEHA
jgi:hypothetical protein